MDDDGSSRIPTDLGGDPGKPSGRVWRRETRKVRTAARPDLPRPRLPYDEPVPPLRRPLPLLLLLGLLAPVPAQEAPAPYAAWLWMRGDRASQPLRLKQALALGFAGVSVEPDQPLEAVRATGTPHYVDQLVGGGILSVKAKVFDKARIASRKPGGSLARTPCLRAAATAARITAQLDKRLAPFTADAPRPRFLSIGDEISFTRNLSPIDWCHGSACLDAFTPWLISRWGSAARAAEVYGLKIDEADDLSARPVGTRAARRAFFHGNDDPRALVTWNDARAFADATLLETVEGIIKEVRRRMPGLPVGLMGGQMPSAFGGYDWEPLLRRVDVVEPYDFGATREMVGALAPSRTDILHTVFPAKRPALAAIHEFYHYFLHGDAGSVVYSDADVLDLETSEPTAWARAVSPHLKRLGSPECAIWRHAELLPPQVAILTSMPTVRAHWLLDSRRDGEAWIHRSTSYENENATQARTRLSWVKLLEDLGLHHTFVTPQRLIDGELEKKRVQALVLPRSLCLSESEVAAIRRFLARGGLVVADCQTGWFDGRMARRAEAALDSLFGIARKDRSVHFSGDRVLPAARRLGSRYPVAEPTVVTTSGRARDVASRIPIFIESGTPRGRTLYLNLILLDYAHDRIHAPQRARWLRERIMPPLLHAGIRPRIEIEVESGEGTTRWPVETFMRRKGDDLFVALQLNLRAGHVKAPWKTLTRQSGQRVKATFPGTFHARNMLTGEDLGPCNHALLTLAPDRRAPFRPGLDRVVVRDRRDRDPGLGEQGENVLGGMKSVRVVRVKMQIDPSRHVSYPACAGACSVPAAGAEAGGAVGAGAGTEVGAGAEADS